MAFACQESGSPKKEKEKKNGEKALCENTYVFDDGDDDDVINVNNSRASTAESSVGRAESCRRRCELGTGYSTSEACLIPALDLIFSRHES